MRATTHEHACSSRSHRPVVEQVEGAHLKLGAWTGRLDRSQGQVSRKRLTAKAEPAAPITIPTMTTNATITVNSPLGTSRLFRGRIRRVRLEPSVQSEHPHRGTSEPTKP